MSSFKWDIAKEQIYTRQTKSLCIAQRLSQLETLHAALGEQDLCPAALLAKNVCCNWFSGCWASACQAHQGFKHQLMAAVAYRYSEPDLRAKCQISVNYEWNTWLCPVLRGTFLLLTPWKSIKQKEKALFSTSYLVGDMLFWCDNLVHVRSKPGIQRDSLHFAWFHQLFILSSGVTQDLSVHRIRDLQGESFSNVWFVLPLPQLRAGCPNPVPEGHARDPRWQWCLTGRMEIPAALRSSRTGFGHPWLWAGLLELTSIQLLCFCCIFPLRRGPIVSLRSEWRVSITRLAKICTERRSNVMILHFLIYMTKKRTALPQITVILLIRHVPVHDFEIKTQPVV